MLAVIGLLFLAVGSQALTESEYQTIETIVRHYAQQVNGHKTYGEAEFLMDDASRALEELDRLKQLISPSSSKASPTSTDTDTSPKPRPPIDTNREIINDDPKVVLIHNFLSAEEADYILHLAEPGLNRSLVAGQLVNEGRTSWSSSLKKSQDEIVRRIEDRAASTVLLPLSHLEPLQLVRYLPGQFYKVHHDYFSQSSEGYDHAMQSGGQRLFTLLVYLNDIPEGAGGETNFPNLGISVQPRKGTAVVWPDCRPDGSLDERTLHEGKPPSEGVKYAMNIWIREVPFGTPRTPKVSSVAIYGDSDPLPDSPILQKSMKVVNEDPKILFVEDFLTPEEVDHIVELGVDRLDRSKVSDASITSDIRTSSSGSFKHAEDDIIDLIETRATSFTLLPSTHAECLQLVKYEPGQFYKAHWDYIAPGSAGYEESMERGGQRKYTILVYLNDIPEGGAETNFPELGVSVQPKKGGAVIWADVDGEGKVNPKTLHEGKAPTSSIKYAMNIWIREKSLLVDEHDLPLPNPKNVFDASRTIVHSDPTIIAIRNFLSIDEINHVLELGIPRLSRSLVAGSQAHESRTSTSVFLRQRETPTIAAIEARVAMFTLSPVANLESIELVRFRTGEFYRIHHDYFTTGAGYDRAVAVGGNRRVTVNVYLNTVPASCHGEDRFPNLDVSIRPEKGTAILFSNMNGENQVEPLLLHESIAPTCGEKYLLNIWVRERPFRS